MRIINRKHFYLSVILVCLGVFVLLFQNCGKAGESSGGSAGLASVSSSTMVHYFVPLSAKVVKHGVTGEIESERPSLVDIYEQRVGVLGDVGGLSGPDGIEDYLVYTTKYTSNSTQKTTSHRKFLIRSGKDDSILFEKAFAEYTIPISLYFTQSVHILEDVDDDGVKDILAFTSRNRFENVSSAYLNTSEVRIFSGANLMQIKVANITDPTGQNEYEFAYQAHVFQNIKKDLIFVVRANYSFMGFQFFDIATTTNIFYDLSFDQFAVGAQVLYDYNEDGKADYTYYNYQEKKMTINSFVNGQEIPDIDFSSFEVPDQWGDFSPELVDWDGDSLPEVYITYSRSVGTSMVQEFYFSIYPLRDLSRPLSVLKAPVGKLFWFAQRTPDINRDGKQDLLVVQKSREDVTGRVEKVAIYDFVTGMNLYEILPSRENNSSYNSMYSHIITRYLNP